MTPRDALMDLFSLDGQVAIVTGGTGRLGSQYANALLSAGAAVSLFDVAAPGPIVRGSSPGCAASPRT
jgi:NAD(P)-dependent dehydrogenase (short-subunit alcohol dehydrogenase family)